MITYKCKMCGGELNIVEGATVCECEYCGSKQTIPSLDNEKKTNLFNRANRLRFNNEFDKASGIYESIVSEFPEESEAYWGLLLCKYGIEYVDDPTTGKKIPTCHRSSYTSIFDDENFELCLEYSNSLSKEVYRNEAKEIDRIQKSILDVASKEEPFDVFICYKETDENGDRTKDSVLAQDIYDKLTEKGYKVFFSRITLEDKLGQEYEPYIFSALNSAKVMLAIGTKYEYYDSVWVKNEWSRFLDLMKSDKDKVLIPCYSDIDAYDMPKEFKNLQGQDMNKLGFIQDLTRGIEKIIPLKKESETKVQTTTIVKQTAGPNVDSLLKRGYMALEDEKWEAAKKYFNDVLDINVECARAYLGLSLTSNHCKSFKEFKKKYLKEEAFIDKNAKRAQKYSLDIEKEFRELEEKSRKKAEEENIKAQKIDNLQQEYRRLRDILFSFDREVEDISDIHKTITDKLNEIRDELETKYSKDVNLLKETLQNTEKSITNLKEEKNNLGFFDGKKKKELDAKISDLSLTTSSLVNEIQAFEDKILVEFENEKNKYIENERNGIQRKIDEVIFQLKNLGESPYKNGEEISLGSYHGEEIIWKVLELRKNSVLVISKNILDAKAYDSNNSTNKWENSTLRNLLNTEFYDAAFTQFEKSKIIENENKDNVSLIGYGQANFLLGDRNSNRVSSGSKWAINNGLHLEQGSSYSPWWLRDGAGTSFETNYAKIVYSDGAISSQRKAPVSDGKIGVRPVLWISTD